MKVKEQGLYLPEFEHDNCGAGFICNLNGIKSNDIIFSQNLSEEEIKSYIEEFAKSKSRNLNSIADEYEEYEDSY